MGIKVSIDIGGTFTDLCCFRSEDEVFRIIKVPTTTHDLSDGVVTGLKKAAFEFNLSIEAFLKECGTRKGGAINFATTAATNAILEEKVGKVGLICTQGHRDILTLREGGKEEPFKLNEDYPDPYVPRYLTLTVEERVDSQGNILIPIDRTDVINIVQELLRYNVEAIAVCLLWSVVNPIHELFIGDTMAAEWPELECVLSHEVNPIVKEYRRAISTVINASLIPVITAVIGNFDRKLKTLGYEGELNIITGYGGIMSKEDILKKPIHTLASGPTGAPVAGLLYSETEFDQNNVVTCDMGGTSFDVSRVLNGVMGETSDDRIGIDHIGIRKVDIRSIGSGGGSIAWVDPGQMLRVGPQSAGAIPGPACYGKGGELPTTTDANLVLGYLNSQKNLGDDISLDLAKAEKVIETHICSHLNLSRQEAAFSIWNTVCANMTDAIRTITSWEGINPEEFIFVSGGGAAGIHIIPMLQELGVKKLIIPKTAGVLSSFGVLNANLKAEMNTVHEWNTKKPNLEKLNEIFGELEAKALTFLNNNNVKEENKALEYSLDARYYMQPWEITIPIKMNRIKNEKDLKEIEEVFHQIHFQKRGSQHLGQFIEISNIRVKAIGKVKQTIHQEPGSTRKGKVAPKSTRKAFFKELGGMIDTKIYDGADLVPGMVIAPPAIIEEKTTTIVVFPKSNVKVSEKENYIVDLTP